MASHLQALGRFCFRRRRFVLVSWIALLVVVGAAAVLGNGSFVSTFSVPGTESQNAMQLLEQRLPNASTDGGSGRAVFALEQGRSFSVPQQQAVGRTIAAIAHVPAVAS